MLRLFHKKLRALLPLPLQQLVESLRDTSSTTSQHGEPAGSGRRARTSRTARPSLKSEQLLISFTKTNKISAQSKHLKIPLQQNHTQICVQDTKTFKKNLNKQNLFGMHKEFFYTNRTGLAAARRSAIGRVSQTVRSVC